MMERLVAMMVGSEDNNNEEICRREFLPASSTDLSENWFNDSQKIVFGKCFPFI